MKIRYYALLASAILLTLAGVAGNSVPVFAQYSSQCMAHISYPAMTMPSHSPPSYYYGSNYVGNVGMTVNVSVNCPLNGRVYVVGNAYDTVLSGFLGSANVMLTQLNNGYFTGQLVFNFPPSIQGHTLQIQISFYNNNGSYNSYGQYGQLLGSTTMTVYPSYSQAYYPGNYGDGDYCYYNSSYYSNGNYYMYPQYNYYCYNRR